MLLHTVGYSSGPISLKSMVSSNPWLTRGCHGNEFPKWVNAYWLSNNVAIEASWESLGQP